MCVFSKSLCIYVGIVRVYEYLSIYIVGVYICMSMYTHGCTWGGQNSNLI